MASTFPVLKTPRLTLRLVELSDVDAILDYYFRNRDHFAATDPPLPEGFYTREYWAERVIAAQREFEEDRAVRFFLFPNDLARNAQVIGTASFSQVFRGPFQACYLGYGIDGQEQGKGLMTEALQASIQYMFREKNLHRIMANHLLDNERSARVLARLGFRVEGVGKDYLWIAGKWRDHVLNALTNPDWDDQAGR